jgi:hypothetical protein
MEETTMIDMHAHWKPAELAEALRARSKEPRILCNQDGIEVLKAPRMGEMPLAEAFDDAGVQLARMDRQGVETSVLSVLGCSAGSRRSRSRWRCRCAGRSTTGLQRSAKSIPDASPHSPRCR